MYAEHRNYVNYFHSDREGTDKVLYGRISESFKNEQSGGTDYETWSARFVGAAKEKAAALKDGSRIVLTKWAARCPYSKEKKQSFPYMLIMDFEIAPERENRETTAKE